MRSTVETWATRTVTTDGPTVRDGGLGRRAPRRRASREPWLGRTSDHRWREPASAPADRDRSARAGWSARHPARPCRTVAEPHARLPPSRPPTGRRSDGTAPRDDLRSAPGSAASPPRSSPHPPARDPRASGYAIRPSPTRSRAPRGPATKPARRRPPRRPGPSRGTGPPERDASPGAGARVRRSHGCRRRRHGHAAPVPTCRRILDRHDGFVFGEMRELPIEIGRRNLDLACAVAHPVIEEDHHVAGPAPREHASGCNRRLRALPRERHSCAHRDPRRGSVAAAPSSAAAARGAAG